MRYDDTECHYEHAELVDKCRNYFNYVIIIKIKSQGNSCVSH